VSQQHPQAADSRSSHFSLKTFGVSELIAIFAEK